MINSSIALSPFSRPLGSVPLSSLFTKGDRASPMNYRPISLLPVSRKVLEKHVHIQLSEHLHTHNLLYPLQSGTALPTQLKLLSCIAVTNGIRPSTPRSVGAVFLDISKAFDTVSHELLSKHANLDLSPPPLPLLGFDLTSPIAPKLLVFLTPTPPRVSLILGSPRALFLVQHYFPLSSMTFPLFFLPTQLFSLLMIRPSLYLAMTFAVFNHRPKPVST